MKKFLYILFIWTAFTAHLSAQINFKTRVSKYELSTDERLRVSFEITSNGENISSPKFTPPDFQGFHKIMGPSQSQEYSYINGRTSFKLSYIYYLQPVKPGTYKIGSAQVEIDGEVYKTQPVTITVTKGQKPVNPVPVTGNPNTDNKTDNVTVKDKIQGAFLTVDITKTHPYVNEAVGLTYKLYIPQNYGVVNYNETGQPQFNGFWAQDVNKNISGPFHGQVNGKAYTYYVLRKKLLFPQHSGKLTIKPLTLQIDLQVPVYRNFFGMRVPDYEIQRVKLTSGKKVLNVKELPKDNQPLDFSGAVGQFDFAVQIDKNQVKAGEPVNVKVQVKGTGNLKLFDLPQLKAPDGLEVYDPKHNELVRTTFKGNTGTVSDEYIIVPNQGGKFIIPGMRFIYFDPQSKTYVTKTSDDIVLFVAGDSYARNNVSNNTASPQKYQGTDFRFIKEKAHFVSPVFKDFYKSKLFNWLIIIPIALAFGLIGYRKYLDSRTFDATLEKQKKNKSLAQKFLKEAKKSLGDKESFYAHLEKAIHNFLKAKLKIDTHEMTRENIRKKLTEKGIKQETIDALIDVLNRCDMARYAPASQNKMEEDLKDAERVMNSF